MTRTITARLVPALRLAGVTVVLAAGIAGFAGAGDASHGSPVQLDLAVVSSTTGH